MQLQELLELSGVILGSIGSGGAIIVAFSSWLGKVWANRLMEKEKAAHSKDLESLRNRLIQDTESYKIKLKKSEFIFQKEFEAASKLSELIQSILPEHYMPNMHWGDVSQDIAMRFGDIEKSLRNYLGTHGAILPSNVKRDIELCIYKAGSGKHFTAPDVPHETSKSAEEIYRDLAKAEATMIEKVKGQVII